MTLSRRQFLTWAKDHSEQIAIGGLLVTLGSGAAYQWYAERALRQELTDKTMPVLTSKSHKEMNAIPRDGDIDIRKLFNGAINKLPRFVEGICSAAFVSELAARQTDDDKQVFMIETFTREVISDRQINARVEAAAENLGERLDENWANCCRELADNWRISIRHHQQRVSATQLLKDIEPLIRSRLKRAMDAAFGNDQMPFIRSCEESLGRSAILVLQLSRVTNRLYLPTFCLQQMHASVDEVQRYLHDRRAHYQNKIADVFVDLSNRVGSSFQTALKLRVSDLHAWQEEALLASVAKRALDATAWFPQKSGGDLQLLGQHET